MRYIYNIVLLLTTILIGCSDDNNPVIPPSDDTIAPDAIFDLAANNPTGSSVMLMFTAPGDDGQIGRAAQYDIRFSQSLITESTFSTASRFDTTQLPNVGTVPDTVIISALLPVTRYYFAVKVGDEAGNWSDISNVDSITTLQGGSWTIFNTLNSELPSDTIFTVITDLATKYYGTRGGAVKQVNTVFTIFDTTLGVVIDTSINGDTVIDTTTILPSMNINSIGVDDANALWIGMVEGGLVRLFDSSTYILYHANNSPLVLNSVKSIAVADSQNIWIATSGDGLFHFDGADTWTHYLAVDGLQNNFLNKLALDEQNNLWISYNFGGATYYDGITFTHYNSGNGLPTLGVSDIVPLGNNRVLFGTEDGVFIKEPASWIHYTTDSGLVDIVVLSVALDSSGNYWFGTRFGLTEKSGSVWTTYTSTNSYLPNNYINDITIDFLNNVIIGTNNGIALYRE